MQLDQLRYFIAVAEELSFRRAAERLRVSQPPLSYHIKALEEEFGSLLFNRTTREVSLTDAGQHLLEKARRLVDLAGETVNEMRSIAAGGAGTLRIGFTMSTSFHRFFYNSVHRYRQLFPAVAVTLSEGVSRRQIDNLLTDRIDIGFFRWPISEIAGLTLTAISKDALVVAMHRSHPQAGRTAIDLTELKNEPFISYPQSSGADIGIYGKIRQLCERAGFVPNVVQEALEPSLTIGLVAAGLGVAIVPSAVQCIQIDDVVFRPIADDLAEATLYLAFREGDRSPRVESFQEIVAGFEGA